MMKRRVTTVLVFLVSLWTLPLFADDAAAPAPAANAPAETAAAPAPAKAEAAPEPAKAEAAPAPQVPVAAAVEIPKPTPAGPLQIKIGENAAIRFGLLLQPQADFLESSNGGYAQNLMIRRARFLIGGQVTKSVFFFFETENARLGNAPASGAKTMSGFQTLDAMAEWRKNKKFNLAGGLIRVPTSRDALESASNEFTIDFNSYAFTATTFLGGTAGRDTGVQARGYFLKDKLEYRVSVVSGMREAGSQNGFRTTGRVQYNFFDTEVYAMPSYAGSNFGNKKIVAVGAALDKQEDYQGLTADLFVDVPTRFGSALTEISYQNLDGGALVPTGLAESKIFTADGGLYFKGMKFGTWARYERREFDVATNRDEERMLIGLNYYPFGNNFNVKTALARSSPAVGPEINQFVVQFQAFYY